MSDGCKLELKLGPPSCTTYCVTGDLIDVIDAAALGVRGISDIAALMAVGLSSAGDTHPGNAVSYLSACLDDISDSLEQALHEIAKTATRMDGWEEAGEDD